MRSKRVGHHWAGIHVELYSAPQQASNIGIPDRKKRLSQERSCRRQAQLWNVCKKAGGTMPCPDPLLVLRLLTSVWDSPRDRLWAPTWASAPGCIISFQILQKKIFIFNWRIIALQYCVDFHHTSTWISHRYIYIWPFPLEPPTPSPPLDCHRAPVWIPWVYSKFPLAIYFT